MDSPTDEFKMIIVMRKDLNMRKGKMVAQGSHSAVGLVLENLESENVKSWLKSSFKKICVSVNSEEELLAIVSKAKNAGLMTKLIRDLGHTEFKEPTLTCAAIGPAKDLDLKPITGQLPLL